MEVAFWQERWRQGQTGFHQAEVNHYLRRFFGKLGLAQGQRVFVPLCGKSLDMVWLMEQGVDVLGIEASPVAIEAFLAENSIDAGVTVRQDSMRLWSAAGIEMVCGDFFDLATQDLSAVNAVYDRAALIALPPAMRERYARHLISILPASAPVLLVTLEYPQQEMQGPPFSVTQDEVARLFSQHFETVLLGRESILEAEPRFRQQGLTGLYESAWQLCPRGRPGAD